MPEKPLRNKIVISTLNKDKKFELSESDFNKDKLLWIEKIVEGQVVENRILKMTNNGKLVMT